MKELFFASGNENKIAEIRSLMPKWVLLKGLKALEINQQIEETESTIEGNAKLKANFIHQNFGVNVFADDTGLEVEMLNGEPGVYSARYAGEAGNDSANRKLLLTNLLNINNRKAQFRTVIALWLDDQYYQFEGVVKGKIATEEYGDKGFGYDSIFIPEGFEKSFAQMQMEEKNAISHRGKAIRQLIAFLNAL